MKNMKNSRKNKFDCDKKGQRRKTRKTKRIKRAQRRRQMLLSSLIFVSLVSTTTVCRAAFERLVLVEQSYDSGGSIFEHGRQSGFVYSAENDDGRLKESEQMNDNENADSSAWNLILVNQWNELPEDFSVDLIELNNGHSVDKRIYQDLQNMMNAARNEGLSPIICSSYRTLEKQRVLFNNKVESYIAEGCTRQEAEKEASKWVAFPGTSEHHTGLAVDIVALSYQMLNEEQENTAEQKWLMENSYKYGFILRYPTDKSDITGIGYEPWHYRYVGKEAAAQIHEKGICLEEYVCG